MDTNLTNSENRIYDISMHRMSRIPSYNQMVIDDSGFRKMLEAQGMSQSSIDRAMRGLHHYIGILGEISNEMRPEKMRGITSTHSYNIIPSNAKAGVCTDLVIALASSSGHPKRRFINVIRELRAHLIQCMHSTQTVFILTDVWDPVKFRESEADLKSHMRRGLKIIPGLVTKNSLIPIDIPFEP